MSETHRDDSAYFRLGAAVATGELWYMGYLGDGNAREDDLRDFLVSFGIKSTQDLETLGMGEAYLSDFRELLPESAA